MSMEMMFPPNSRLLEVLVLSKEAVVCLSVKHSESKKAHGFGYLARQAQ